MKIEFSFNGSRRSYLKVKRSNHLDKAKKRLEFIEIPGRTGDLIIDDGSRDNLKITIECYIDIQDGKSIQSISDDLDNWLNAPIGYQDLIFNDGTKFKAVFTSEISLESNFKPIQDIVLVFSAVRSD